MDYYRTSDLQIASFLLCEGVSFIKVDHARVRKEFVFERDSRINALLQGFLNETILIAPRKYMAAFKQLKNQMYQINL